MAQKTMTLSSYCKTVFLLALFFSISFSICSTTSILGCSTYLTTDPGSVCPCTLCYMPSLSLQLMANDNLSCCLTSAVANCLSCAGSIAFVCTQCATNYGLTATNSCTLCSSMPNCLQCVYHNVCSVCSSGYTPYLGNCVSCSQSMSNCTSCSTSAATCSSCTNISYVLVTSSVPNQCQLCSYYMPACTQCSGSTVCNKCDSSISKQNGTACTLCSQMIPYCLVCSGSNTACSQCNSSDRGLLVGTGGGADSCLPCSGMNNCLECTVITSCTKCNNMSVLSGGSCAACLTNLPGCLQCTSAINCTLCQTPSFFLNPTTGTCQVCSGIILNCLVCLTSLICITCQQYYFPSYITPNSTVCLPCSLSIPLCLNCVTAGVCTSCSKGYLVNGGCTNVIGCISANFSSSNSLQNCLRCETTAFLQFPVNNTCLCKTGINIGRGCSNVSGCTQTILKNNTYICVACNYSNNFVFNSSTETCVCISHYQLSGSICAEICGDGLLFNLQCDDGNNLSNDGCSISCHVQSGYTCFGGSPVSSTRCVYKGRIEISVHHISKINDANSLQIYVNVSPFTNLLYFMNLTRNLHLSLYPPFDYTLVKSSFVGQQIVLDIDYHQTIEQSTGKIVLQFDSYYVRSPNATTNFLLKDINKEPLTYDPYIYRKYLNFNDIIMILSLVTIVIFIFGSFAYKMIGIETIHTVQLIFILLANSKYYRRVYWNLNFLTIAMGQYRLTSIGNILRQKPMENYQLSQNTIDNYLLIGCLEAASLVIYVIFRVYQKNIMQKALKISEKKPIFHEWLKQKQYKIERIIVCFEEFIVSSLFIGFFFHFMNSLTICSTQEVHERSSIEIIILLIILFGKSHFFFKQLKWIFLKQKKQQINFLLKSSVRYVAFYLFNSILQSICMSLSLLKLNIYFFYEMAAISILMMIYIMAVGPYRSGFHNVIIFFNQMIVLLTSVWMIISERNSNYYETEELVIYALVLALIVVLLLAGIRTAVALKLWYDRRATQTKERNHNKFKEDNRQLEQNLMKKYHGDQMKLITHQVLPRFAIFFKDREEADYVQINQTKYLKDDLRIKIISHREKYRQGQ